MNESKKGPWGRHGEDDPPIALPDRSTKINVTDLKERVMVAREFTPLERVFILDCINDAAKPK